MGWCCDRRRMPSCWRRRADHAQPAVVVDEGRLQADARELAEQVGLLRRQAGAAEHADSAGPVRGLDPPDLRRDAPDRLVVAHRAEPGRHRFITNERGQQAIGMRSLEVALDAFRAQHPAIEGKLLPRLEADDLVVEHLELNAALLSAETAVRLHQLLGLDAGRQPRTGHRRQVGPKRSMMPSASAGIFAIFGYSDAVPVPASRHKAPCARPNSARRHRGQTC